MKKIILIVFIIIGCQNSPEQYQYPARKEVLNLLILDCLNEYKILNPLYPIYAKSEFKNYSSSCETVIIGDSSMDRTRVITFYEHTKILSFYDRAKTYNYAVSGNTACDYLYQLEAIKCHPKNVLIATGDGNGVKRNISSQTSIDTIRRVTQAVKSKWNANIIIIGIHPLLLTNENISKNAVNLGVSQLGYCFINPLPIFGVGENDPPDSSLMRDLIHYNAIIYPRYKEQIKTQCGVNF